MPKSQKRKLRADLSPTAVAAIIGKPYQTARNMMLSGRFGPTKYDDEKKKLTVRASAVYQWKRQQQKTPISSPKKDKIPEIEKTGL